MMYMRQVAVKLYWYLIGAIVAQFFILLFRNAGFFPLWTSLEYMQLFAYIPLYNFKLIPYLYDAFKPFLVSHLMLTDEALILTEMDEDYININYDYYSLSIAKLAQALFLMACGLGLVIATNIFVGLAYLCCPESSFPKAKAYLGDLLRQYRFNAYIRYYMLCYFDLTFFAIIKLL